MNKGMMNFVSSHQYEFTVILRLILSSVCGGIVGVERELKGRPAGLKTFSLVCLGSTLAMITNEYIYLYIAGSTGDVARMATQVISGIGFLGAGTIIVTGNAQIKGLTTAAALWVTASIGIAIGAGFYFGGILGVIVIVVTSKIYNYIDSKIGEYTNILRLFIEGEDETVLKKAFQYFEENNYNVINIHRTKENKWFKEDTAAVIEVMVGNKKHSDVLDELNKMPEVLMVREIER
ncbi:MAG: MgtC/SapB family protein [Lachnospiraceae bacterium]|nr:MgtC/SapB family protein [Lachnospiraceae bacterium]MDD3615327.1 MgtC/SapB family protein [Lachnospiraceae bacterium]